MSENKCPRCGAPLPADSPEGLCPRCLVAMNLGTQTDVPGEPGPQGTQAQRPPPAPPLPVAEVAKLFPQLEILECLGRGGMGAVYKARQPRLDRIVALKILSPEKQGEPKFGERFEREARALAKLHHPNIVTVYDFGEVQGNFFLLMEFVDGLTLRQLLQQRKLSPTEALAIVPKICEALQYAHDQGIVHRDIKPENILLDKTGRVKIADFGIAKIIGDGGSTSLTAEQVVGTPHYMSPEQIEHPQRVDHRADIYSLGVVFYEMLTGELPLGKFAPPSQKVQVDVRLDEVVLHALEKEPERRYQRASEVKTQVETIAQTPSPAGGGSGGAAFADAVLARDYSLNISHCLDRGWRLLTERFWPTVGVSALVWILWSLAGSSLVGLIIVSPLVGGLWLYFLNRLRGKPATLETAFSGFQVAFLQLVLAGIVTKVLTVVGFICLVLPGIYLWVAWTFALPLVADRRMDFWSAMNLSRKVVSRHWWKFFWFQLVLLLIYVAGLALCYVGIFVAVPFCLAALACAYEDIFSTPAAPDAPGTHRPAPPSSFGFTAGIILAAVLLASIGLLSIFSFYRLVHSHPTGVGRPPLTNTGILPVPAGCVACWHADGNAIDSVHGHDGVLQRVRFADGVVGSAFVFDPNSFQRGTYVGVDIPDDPAFALTNAFSIEGWVRPCGDGYTIFWRGDHRPGLDPYFISMGGGHTLQFCICDEFGNLASVGVPVRYDEWSHLAATFADGDMKLYLNGVLAAETNTVVRPFAQLNAGESPGIGIGNVNDGGNDFPFVGDIDEIALYDRALSAAEVRVIYLDEKAAQSNPPASATQSPSVVPSRTPRSSRNETAGARAAADQWLGIIDAGRYVESWRDASDFFRDAMVESGWVASMNAYRQPLGAVISRKPVSAEPATDLPGAPDGQYVVMQFSTVFANKKSAVETVTFVREKDGQWKAAGYFIR